MLADAEFWSSFSEPGIRFVWGIAGVLLILVVLVARFARDTVDPEVSAIGVDDQPNSSNFDPIPNGTRFSKGAYHRAGRND